MRTALLLFASIATTACTQVKSSATFDEASSFRVVIDSGDVGSAESPLPFSPGGSPYTLSITAIDPMGEPLTTFDGPVVISSEPGTITGPAVTLSGGEATATVNLERAFGVTRIWVEDPETYATGVTEAIYIRGPTIPDLQTSSSTTASPFEGERVMIDVESPLVVVGLARDGFYITDTSVAGGDWASMYAFNFNAPDDLYVGDRVTNVSGRISEFLGFTELVNPSWEVDGTLPVPDPIAVDCAQVQSPNPNLAMEALEAGLIQVNDATVEVCGSFPDCPDYDEYRQWTLDLGGCRVNAITRYSLSGFDPRANVDKVITRMTGTLRHIQFASPQWILEPRNGADVCCPTCSPAYNEGC